MPLIAHADGRSSQRISLQFKGSAYHKSKRMRQDIQRLMYFHVKYSNRPILFRAQTLVAY